MQRVLVVGAGLIGTSVGLALRLAEVQVCFLDRDPARARFAAELGDAEVAHDDGEPAELAVVAVPPADTAQVVLELQRRRPERAVTDTAGVKALVARRVRADSPAPTRYVGGHPVAGRERSGPDAARADLFRGRPWVLTPGEDAEPGALELVRRLVDVCGAAPVQLTPAAHDELFAAVSHVPQLVASALAELVAEQPGERLALAGQGLRDMLRIAGSDPELWAQVAVANADEVAPLLGRLARRLAELAARLAAADTDAHDTERAAGEVRRLVAAGNAGVARLPGKRGGPAQAFARVPVVVSDAPGQLARLLTDIAAAGVNVEDLAVEHSPGQPLGVIEVAVLPDVAERLRAQLRARDWTV